MSIVFMKAFGGLFAVMNPFIALPIFLSMTDQYTPQQRRKSALRVSMYVAIMGAVFFFSGEALLHVFGISINDFQLAGGLMLLIIALGMLNGGGASAHVGSKREQAEQAQQIEAAGDIAFYPLTFPIIFGPGTITEIVVLNTNANGIAEHAMVGISLILIVLATGIVLYFAGTIGKLMSDTLRTIMSRLMGMILAAIAVEMMADAALNLFPGWR